MRLIIALVICGAISCMPTHQGRAAQLNCDEVDLGWRPKLPVWNEQRTPLPTVAPAPGDSIRFIRDRFGVLLQSHARGPQLCHRLSELGASVVGGTPDSSGNGMYVLGLPDPGPSMAAWQALSSRLKAVPEFRAVVELTIGDQLVPRPSEQ